MTSTVGEPRGGHRPLAVYLLVRMVIGLGLVLAAPFASPLDVHWPLLSLPVLLAVGLTSFVLWLVAVLASGRYGARAGFVWTQVVLDAVLVTVLIHLSGGPRSGLFFLYVPNIFAAGMLLRPNAALVVSVLDLLGFLLGTAALMGASIAANWDMSLTELTYELVLRSLALLLIGMLVRLLTEQLRRLHREQVALLDELPAGVLLLGEGRVIVTANSAAERMVGPTVGRTLGEVLDPVGPTWEHSIQRGDEVVHLLCSRSELETGGEVVLIEDITQLRKIEANLAAEERLAAVGRLTAALAHEIRNPLASLSGAVQLLAEERPDPLHDIVHREVKRINGLVEELLDQARPLDIVRQPVEPRSVLEEVALTLRLDPRYRERIDVQVSVEAGCLAPLDPGRFRQVIWNLMLNAAQAIPERGEIRLSARLEGDDLVVGVGDNGVGIPPEAQRKLFDPFFTTRNGGTGLGLSTVHRIVVAHGGSIRVDSVVGRGTSFQIRFPMVEANLGG